MCQSMSASEFSVYFLLMPPRSRTMKTMTTNARQLHTHAARYLPFITFRSIRCYIFSQPCDLCSVTLPDGSKYMCKGRCGISVYVYSYDHYYGQIWLIADILSDVEHEGHQCDAQYCPIPCQLCKRLCSSLNHLHALEEGAIHLCG